VLQALRSVFLQSYEDYEVIVVDDGSTDGTRQALEPLGERIRYVYQKNLGDAGARNRGLSAARGDRVAFLDSDDAWAPEHLETQLGVLRDHPKVALVCAHSLTAGRPAKKLAADREVMAGDLFCRLFQKNFVNTSTVVARKACLEEAGGFNPAYPLYADYDLWLRVARRHELAYTAQTLARCGRQGDNLSKDSGRSREMILEILSRNYDPSRIAYAVYQRRLAECCLRVGRSFRERGQMEHSWKYYRQARRLAPFSLRPYRYLLRGLLSMLRPF
jgi:glycosyltransferase involved in cell wall biosynthesis